MKNPPSKVAHIRPPTFLLCTGLAAQTAQKQKSRTTLSPLMQDWVFRMGLVLYLLSLENLKKNLAFNFLKKAKKIMIQKIWRHGKD